MSAIFIVGAARSGTTSILQALDLSEETYCLSEPVPNLNYESRVMMDGQLPDPYRPLAEQIAPRLAAGLSQKPHYVEKQVSLAPFLPALDRLFNCRFVVPIRDGRDVVKSLINWHNQIFPIIYQECTEAAELAERAKTILDNQDGVDPFDFSLPRPHKTDPAYDRWDQFSRFQMVTWYWRYTNRLLLNVTGELNPARYLFVDYTAPTIDTIREIYDFVGLTDFDADAVVNLLDRRINSLEDRVGDEGQFPSWPDWSDEQLQQFFDIAYDMLHELGYAESATRPQPPGFGEWWSEPHVNPDWYQEIYEYREPSHRSFQRWVDRMERSTGRLNSVVDFGSGIGHGYRDLFADRAYLGIDMAPHVIEYCRQHNNRSEHTFECVNLLEESSEATADLVFSHATIDNVYDIDACLRALARMTKRHLYVTNYRGYFGDLERHRYEWDPHTRVCFNDVSARQIHSVLQAEGFQSIAIFPQATEREDITSETVIIASREKIDPEVLTAGHKQYFEFPPYQVVASDQTLDEVIQTTNERIHYFSEWANDLDYFRRVLESIKQHDALCCGTMRDLADSTQSVRLGLRVDLDMDLVAAIEMAKISQAFEVPLSFYILHTAGFYGSFEEQTFYRNESIAESLLQIQSAGCEIGLHVDPYSIYLDQGIDGAQAVTTELEWLRSCGLNITGYSGHNAAPVYGAESIEIFRGRSIRTGAGFLNQYTFMPLGVLEESQLGLTYEASGAVASENLDSSHPYLQGIPEGDFLRDPQWMRTYLLDNPYCRWGDRHNIWLIGPDSWVISRYRVDGEDTFLFGVPWSEVDAYLATMTDEDRIAITLHPAYFGRRAAAGEMPIGTIRCTETVCITPDPPLDDPESSSQQPMQTIESE